jgi:hypothetical protein
VSFDSDLQRQLGGLIIIVGNQSEDISDDACVPTAVRTPARNHMEDISGDRGPHARNELVDAYLLLFKMTIEFPAGTKNANAPKWFRACGRGREVDNGAVVEFCDDYLLVHNIVVAPIHTSPIRSFFQSAAARLKRRVERNDTHWPLCVLPEINGRSIEWARSFYWASLDAPQWCACRRIFFSEEAPLTKRNDLAHAFAYEPCGKVHVVTSFREDHRTASGCLSPVSSNIAVGEVPIADVFCHEKRKGNPNLSSLDELFNFSVESGIAKRVTNLNDSVTLLRLSLYGDTAFSRVSHGFFEEEMIACIKRCKA